MCLGYYNLLSGSYRIEPQQCGQQCCPMAPTTYAGLSERQVHLHQRLKHLPAPNVYAQLTLFGGKRQSHHQV